MPEPITFTNEETPALSPQNIQALETEQTQQAEGEEPSLLAGKYKTVEELEKAYKEAQRKLSQPREDQPAGQEPTDEEGEGAEEGEAEEKPTGNAREIYGEVIGSRLDEAGVDFQSMSERFTQSGALQDGDYTQLEEAGFTRAMVDAYLSGLNYQANKDSQLAVQEVASIKQEYGGEAQYNAMIEWAATNLPQEEVDAFNQVVNGQPLNVVRLAVAGLQAKYTGAVGREPKLVSGRAPKGATESFESTAQVVEAMKDPRYASDPAYRRKVEARLAKSSIM